MDSAATTFVLVSFTDLSRALAAAGHQTHVLFVGDPSRPAVEVTNEGRLVLHRWCQWLSKYYPRGVYDGEEAKLHDFNESAPRFIVDDLVRPALAVGQRVIVMGEEWQTAKVAWYIRYLERSPGVAEEFCREARRTAHRFPWDRVVDRLMGKVELLAACQGMSVTEPPVGPHVDRPRAVRAPSATLRWSSSRARSWPVSRT